MYNDNKITQSIREIRIYMSRFMNCLANTDRLTHKNNIYNYNQISSLKVEWLNTLIVVR